MNQSSFSCSFLPARDLERGLRLTALLGAVLGLGGCGASLPAPRPILAITPAAVALQADLGQQQFAITSVNQTSTSVVWKVNGLLGGDPAHGTIDAGGLYHAPAALPAPAQVQVTAVSQVDSRSSATAVVTVTPPVAVTLSPANPTVRAEGTLQFVATVANATNTAVTWQVNGVAGGAPATGTITASGLYTAPANFPGTAMVTVTAASVQDPRQAASAPVTLVAGVRVTLTPHAVSLALGAQQSFTATVDDSANAAVSWSVNGVPGGSKQAGLIDAVGTYTAPNALPPSPQVKVRAMSLADQTATDSAIVTLQVPPNAFSLAPTSASLTLAKGTALTQPFQLTTSQGFSGSIKLAASGLPPNLAASFDHPSLTQSGPSTLTLAAASISLATTNTPITVTATSTDATGLQTVQTATLLVTIQGWNGRVRTLAGAAGGPGFEDGSGTSDELEAFAITGDGGNHLYFLDGQGFALRHFNRADGSVTTLNGSPYTFPFADGQGVALDPRTQTFYIADAGANRILRYTIGDAQMTVLAGGSGPGYADGLGGAARFSAPRGIALSPDHTTLYIADANNDLIRRLDIASGVVTTLAGQPGTAGSQDGIAGAASFCRPWGVALDNAAANLYIADTCSFKIRRLSLPGLAVATLAGSGQQGGGDGPAASATFLDLHHLALDPHQNGTLLLYITDGSRIRALTLGTNPTVFTVAGQFNAGHNDGSVQQAAFAIPRDLFAIPDLNGTNTTSLFIADSNNGLLRQLDLGNPLTATNFASVNGKVTTLAGQVPNSGLADGRGTGPNRDQPDVAQFNGPSGIVTDGTVAYVADAFNSAIRQIDVASSTVSTVAGPGYGTNDGPALSARFNEPSGLAWNQAGGLLYIADTGNNEIRKLDLNAKLVTTLAGGPAHGFQDGSLASTRFDQPSGLAVSADGNTLYVADGNNNAIRKLDLAGGTVSTLAGGTAGTQDGVGAAARFNYPVGLVLDAGGKLLYVADYANHTIRQIELATAKVTTLAGTAGVCGKADGFGTTATLCSPAMLGSDGHTLFWGDSTTGLVRCFNLSTGQVSTLAGTPGVLHLVNGDYQEIPGTLTGPVRYNSAFGIAAAPDGSFLLYAERPAHSVRIVQ